MRKCLLVLLIMLSSCAGGAVRPLPAQPSLVCGAATPAQRDANRAALTHMMATQRLVTLPACPIHIASSIVLVGITDLRVQGAGSAVLTTSDDVQPGIVSHDPSQPILSIAYVSKRIVIADVSFAYSTNAAVDVPAIHIEDSASIRLNYVTLLSPTIYDGIHFDVTDAAPPCGDGFPGDGCTLFLTAVQMNQIRGNGVIVTGKEVYGKRLGVVSTASNIAGGLGVPTSASYKSVSHGAILVDQGNMYLQAYGVYCGPFSTCVLRGPVVESLHNGVYATGPGTNVLVTNSFFVGGGSDDYQVRIENDIGVGQIESNMFAGLVRNAILVNAANVSVANNVFYGGPSLTAITGGAGSVIGTNVKFGGIN